MIQIDHQYQEIQGQDELAAFLGVSKRHLQRLMDPRTIGSLRTFDGKGVVTEKIIMKKCVDGRRRYFKTWVSTPIQLLAWKQDRGTLRIK